jgi:hypothetical protein
VEFHAVDVKRRIGNPEAGQALPFEEPLIGEIVDRQDGRDMVSAPRQIGRGKAGRPVVEVQEIGAPQGVAEAAGNVGRSQPEAREADCRCRSNPPRGHRRRASPPGRRVRGIGARRSSGRPSCSRDRARRRECRRMRAAWRSAPRAPPATGPAGSRESGCGRRNDASGRAAEPPIPRRGRRP